MKRYNLFYISPKKERHENKGRNETRTASVTAILLSSAIILTSCIKDREPAGADLKPGDILPEFSVTLDDGSTISNASLEGSVSCIMFFHTGCPDCKATIPEVQKLSESRVAVEKDIKFVCISREEGRDEIKAFWDANKITLPFSAQEDRSVYNKFATTGVPRIYISDRNCRISAVWSDDPTPQYEELEEAVRKL